MSLGSSASAAISSKRCCADVFELVQAARVLAPAGLREVLHRDRIEVVVGQQNEAEAQAPQCDDFFDHVLHGPLARLLPVGLPHRAERAVLGAAANGLHRSPHVAIGRHADPSARTGKRSPPTRPPSYSGFSVPCWMSCSTSGHTRSPSPLTTACAAPRSWASSGKSVEWMPPKTTVAPRSRTSAPELVATQCIARVDADARPRRLPRRSRDRADPATRPRSAACRRTQASPLPARTAIAV